MSSVLGILAFITGILSPVRIDSFTIALPVIKTISQGNTRHKFRAIDLFEIVDSLSFTKLPNKSLIRISLAVSIGGIWLILIVVLLIIFSYTKLDSATIASHVSDLLVIFIGFVNSHNDRKC